MLGNEYPKAGLRSAGAPSAGVDEVQTLTFANITAGTFKLKWKGRKTAAITWSATNATLLANIDAALGALPGMGAANVLTAEGSLTAGLGTVRVTFQNTLGKAKQPLLEVTDKSLTGTGADITVSETTVGVHASGRGASKGTLLTDETNGNVYINTGTADAPVWAPFGVVSREVIFTEDGAGTYTGAVDVPAGATLLDIIVNGVALWSAATSAVMKVGDATDDDGYFTGVDLKATDLLAGESISFALAGGKAGAYIANSQVSPRYAAAARVIRGIVTSVGAGTAGRTRMIVVFVLPSNAGAATKA